jgi:hypothetical protein
MAKIIVGSFFNRICVNIGWHRLSLPHSSGHLKKV